ncbi:glutathione synthase/RimK-type ligase-like ATP-grasp enzyme [Paraburkholderia sp. GAS199]|uniref:ATP-grasp domain-containing protein n=1 Tax=Paraburkholderia sp. GAS199 TaxID=3035126 RepID=UPI003D2486DB
MKTHLPIMTEPTHALYRPLGLSVLLRAASAGEDLTPLGVTILDYAQRHDDPVALLDLALLLQMKYEKEAALSIQDQALKMRRHYRIKEAAGNARPLKLLVLKSPGDLMANTPFECLLEKADLQIDVLYVDAELPREYALPEHDVVMVAACANDANNEVLARIAALLNTTRKRVVNAPQGIAHTTRDGAYALLGGVRGIRMAPTVRVSRAQALELGSAQHTSQAAPGMRFPLIIRPVGSHAGQDLERMTCFEELAAYVERSTCAEFYVAPFIDYRSADGLFRKYRIVMIGKTPYLCHMGISAHWMVHYPYQEMIAHAERRDEEARAMSGFDSAFAIRHREAMQAVVELTGLDYVGFDCAESADGQLVIFEIATGMVVHDMDDPVIFPYKQARMRRVFDAFHQMLVALAASRAVVPI